MKTELNLVIFVFAWVDVKSKNIHHSDIQVQIEVDKSKIDGTEVGAKVIIISNAYKEDDF